MIVFIPVTDLVIVMQINYYYYYYYYYYSSYSLQHSGHVSPVFDLSGEGMGGLTHWLMMTPTGDCKVSPGVGFDPLRRVQNPNSSLNPYELMSDIIQTHLQKLFCDGL